MGLLLGMFLELKKNKINIYIDIFPFHVITSQTMDFQL